MKYPRFTHEQHCEFAKSVKSLEALVTDLFYDVQLSFGKSHKVSTTLWKMLVKVIPELKSELDNEYHKVTTQDQFIIHGHVYYGRRGFPKSVFDNAEESLTAQEATDASNP